MVTILLFLLALRRAGRRGGPLLRFIGIVRARARISLRNLAYNMRRMVQLDALATARAPT